MPLRNVFFFLLIGFVAALNANDTTAFKAAYLTANYQLGFIGDPDYNNQHLLTSYPNTYRISYEQPTTGEHAWQRFYNYPSVGVTFQYIALPSQQQLGSISSITPFIKIAYPRHSTNRIALKLGIGAAWANKPYHRTENYKNQFLGSHVNVNLFTSLEYQHQITNRIIGFTGLAVQHFSNGNTIVPNDGINIFSIHAGLGYQLPPIKSPITPKTFRQNPFELNVITTASLTNQRKQVQRGFQYFNVMLEGMKIYKKSVAYGLGFDVTYNNSDSLRIKYKNDFTEQSLELGVKTMFGSLFGNFEVLMQPGLIFYPKAKGYTWIAIRYQVTQRIKASLNYRYYFYNGNHLSFGLCYTVF